MQNRKIFTQTKILLRHSS